MAAAAEKQTERAKPLRVRVKDGRIGYYNSVRWRSGQVFELNSPKDFSEKWMEKVNPATRLDRPMSGKQALDKAVEAIRGGNSINGLVTDAGTDLSELPSRDNNDRSVI